LSRKSRTAMEDHSSMVLSKPSTLILSMSWNQLDATLLNWRVTGLIKMLFRS
jgi:hypothetical protein